MEEFRMQEQAFTAVRDMLEHAVYHVVSGLRITGYTSREPLPFAARTTGSRRVWQPGEPWGELFDCGWFHFTGPIPPEAADRHLAVLVDLSAEGLIVDRHGDPVQGITSATSRNEFPLGLWGKRTVELRDCLSEDGTSIDVWGDFTCMDIEGQYKNNGRIKEACLAEIDDLARDCFYDWVVCQSLFVGLCENGDPYGQEVGAVLEQAARVLTGGIQAAVPSASGADTEALMMGRHAYSTQDSGLDRAGERLSIWPDPETEPTRKQAKRLPAEALNEVRRLLAEILSRPCDENPPLRYSSIGHSHLDLLFLWPVRETPRKCARTLSTVMKLMDRFPEYRFTLSQAPVYQWLKDQYPTLYARMLQRIRERRLEVVGALYIECDTNLPGGESLVRQLLYGKRFFLREFGLDMQVGFLPDVFGYSAALPQLFIKAGVPYFTTNKLSMNDTNRFPRYTFWWHGLDGTKILTHMLPENSYTSASVPQMAIYGQYHDTDLDVCPQGLQLYGLGDGGGGPGYEHMERRRRARNLKGCPPLEDEFVVDFFKRIEKNADRFRSWHGELYFERHQGTYTSMARQKKWNRTLEQDLHLCEWLASLADGSEGYTYPRRWLEEMWQDVMLFQFHDCLPGSAIDLVYAETQARYAQRHREAQAEIDRCLAVLGRCLDGTGLREPVLVCNPTSVWRRERLALEDRELYVDAEPYTVRLVDFAAAVPAAPMERSGPPVLENGEVRLDFAEDGTVTRIYDKRHSRDLVPRGSRGNVLKLYPDENTHWDIEKAYLDRPGEQAELTGWRRMDVGTRQQLELSFRAGLSTIRQQVCLDGTGARVDFRTEVDWQEEYQMLRVLWPVDVVAEQAACDIQFGHVFRPTHQNTTWDQAKFEVCAHKWADMADRTGGLALLSDCKYGYKLWDEVLDLCLLRSQNCPCDHGDRGLHRFTYAIYPHGGGVWDGGVVREGYRLNQPLEVRVPETCGTVAQQLPRAVVERGSVVLETVKLAEDSSLRVLRFYEAAGGAVTAHIRLEGWEAVALCDLLERPLESPDLKVTPDGAEIHFHAFEVQSLLVRIKQEDI